MQDPSAIDDLAAAYPAFLSQFKSVVLGTANETGQPQASYAPCIIDSDLNIYIFVSGLSAHTQNLLQTGTVSALFVEDEAQTTQIFARKRLTYHCQATCLERGSSQWDAIAQQFQDRFGNIVDIIKGLADFRIFQLRPQAGRFVMGFGAAYDIDPDDPSKLVHVSGR